MRDKLCCDDDDDTRNSPDDDDIRLSCYVNITEPNAASLWRPPRWLVRLPHRPHRGAEGASLRTHCGRARFQWE